VRADVEGNERGILILTMSTKPTLSFLLLHHSHSSSFLQAQIIDLLELLHSIYFIPPPCNVKYKMQKIVTGQLQVD
jgi:hypothetical protein